MNNFDTLRTALEAGPTAGPWSVFSQPVISPIVAAMELAQLAHGSEFRPVLPMVVGGPLELCTATTGCGPTSETNAAYIAAADPATIAALLAALDDARADLAKHKAHIRLTNDIITNHCIAMQSALIEQSIGKGDEAALDWIGNTLAGPGLLPSMSDAAHLPDTPTKGPAQAWFDAKTEEHEAMRAKQDAAMKGAA